MATAGTTNSSLEVQLLKAPNGEVLFLECNANFVDALTRLLQAPLGAVVRSCSDEKGAVGLQTCPLLGLTTSVPELRDAVFEAKKADVIPEKLDLTFLSEQGCKGGLPSPFCLVCLKFSGKKVACQAGAICNHDGDRLQCTKSFTRMCTSCGLKIHASDPNQFAVCCGQNFAHLSIVQHPTWKYCAKCAAEDKGQQLMAISKQCERCGLSNSRTCSSCRWCDACAAVSLGFDLPGSPENQHHKGFFKETAKFMVSNSLEVFEASPLKMIELVSSKVDGFKGLKTCTVTVTTQHIKQIMLCSLLGSSEVLTETFGKTASKDEFELGSEAGTNDSFDVVSEADINVSVA